MNPRKKKQRKEAKRLKKEMADLKTKEETGWENLELAVPDARAEMDNHHADVDLKVDMANASLNASPGIGLECVDMANARKKRGTIQSESL